MPVTRSRTSEHSAPEIVSEDVKQVEEDKEIVSLTTPKEDVAETKVVEPEIITTASNEEEAATTPIVEESNNVTEEADEHKKVNGEVGVEENENNLNKRKSIDGDASEVPDSTLVTNKKAKLDSEVPDSTLVTNKKAKPDSEVPDSTLVTLKKPKLDEEEKVAEVEETEKVAVDASA